MTESRETLHPGRILLLQAMEPLGISRNQLARDIDVPVGRISDITNGKRGVTADTALRLGRYFGTGPELWLRLQAEFDLHVARMTTWPAVESRVRVLTSDVPAAAPVAELAEIPTAGMAAASAEAPSEALDEAPADVAVSAPLDDMPPVDDGATEKKQFVGTGSEPLAEAFGEEPGSASDADPEPDKSTAELVRPPNITTELEKAAVDAGDNEEQMSSSSTVTEIPRTGDADNADNSAESNPDPYVDRDAELGIPPIPDQSKLYQSG